VNPNTGEIYSVPEGGRPRPGDVRLSPAEAAALEPLPESERPAEYKRLQLRAARALLKRVREVTGVSLKVYRVNGRDWVAAASARLAVEWYEAQEGSLPAEGKPREISQWGPVGSGGEQRPLWFHVADRLRARLSDYVAGTPLPDDLTGPFVVATGGEGERA
jgi:hypothetical protein